MIRMATVADVPAMLEIYGPYILNSTYTFEYTVPSVEEFTERFLTCIRQFPWLVWEEDGTVLGYAYGSAPFERAAYSWCGEVSIYLSPKIQGKGVGRKLYAVLEDILWKQGYRVIYSLITTENTGSLSFHERLGYKKSMVLERCGIKFGRWLGIVWMEKRLDIVEMPEEQPASWKKIVNNDEKLKDILDNLSLS